MKMGIQWGEKKCSVVLQTLAQLLPECNMTSIYKVSTLAK